MRVALVHDFLTEYGGAERVLEALHEIWPDAPVYTAFYDPESLGPNKDKFKNWEIRISWAKNLPFFKKLLSPYRIFGPLIFESFDFKNYDLVVSSTNVYFAKSIITGPKTIHICYCHTPPRYLYGYPTAREWKKYLIGRILGEIANHFLRIWDYWAAQRVDYFVANSKNTRARIKKFYRRDSEVIYPPVDVKCFARSQSTDYRLQPKRRAVDRSQSADSYFLCVSRLARAKRIDLAILAAQRLGLHLKIVGTGREEKNLKQLAESSKQKARVEFLGEVSDEKLISAYQNCQTVIFPAEEEDFGIVPVEAMACGKPVIALRQGGVEESIIEAKTGFFFDDPTPESLTEVLKKFNPKNFRSQDCIVQAQKFSKEEFKNTFKRLVKRVSNSQSGQKLAKVVTKRED
jgi:glycosyltransferase involved in cell wall biosynthesis